MNVITVKYHDGDSCVTSINGTHSQIVEYFLGSIRDFEHFGPDGVEISNKKICVEIQFDPGINDTPKEQLTYSLTDKQTFLAAFRSGDKNLILHFLKITKATEDGYWERITEHMNGFQTQEVLKSVLLGTWNYILETDDFQV
jgi:hypothetical protein